MTDLPGMLRGMTGPWILAVGDGGLTESADRLGAAPYWVLSIYLGVLLCLGLLGWYRSRAGEEDYYLASRGQGWVISSLTIMATFFSSFALLGAPGMVYREGVSFALYSLNVPVAGLCVYLLGSRIWRAGRELGYVTPGDMIADYYGAGSRTGLRLLVALTSFLYALPYVVMQIQSGGLVSEKLFGDGTFATGATVLAGITMLYIMIGGMRSVAWTDLIQGLLLITGMLTCGMAMLFVFDGPENFSRQIQTELPPSSLTVPGNTGMFSWTFLFTVCLLGSTGSMVQPAQWMRYYSARSSQSLKRGAVIFAAVLTSCFIVGVMLIGLAGQVLWPLHRGVSVAAEHGPETIATVPDELQQHFRYTPPTEGIAGQKAQLEWTWVLRDGRRPPTEAELAQLAALSPDPAYQSAVAELRTTLEQNKDRVIPNPEVGADFDAILISVLRETLPEVLGAFGAIFASMIVIAIMAASMSTADSNLHALSAVLTRDIYDQFVRPKASEKERVWIGRSIIVIVTILALGIVIFGRKPEISSRYDFLKMIAQMGFTAIDFSAQLLPLTIDMLFIRRGTGKGAAAGLAVGLLFAFLFGPLFAFTVDVTGSPELLSGLLAKISAINAAVPVHRSVWGLLVNVPVFVIVSMLTRGPAPEKIAEYDRLFSGRPRG